MLLLCLTSDEADSQLVIDAKSRITGLRQTRLTTPSGEPTPCYKILLDPKKDDVIVGCKNFIYRLDGESLEQSEKLSNGPVQDNAYCRPPPIPCKHTSTVLTDQENRILLINEDTKPNPTIITCGTAKQGMCFLIKYTNFASYGYFGSPEHTDNYIASRKNTIAFFSKSGNGSILIVGHEPDERPAEFSQPLISARKMDVSPFPRINYVYSDKKTKVNSFVDLHPEIKSHYRMNLVYGFEYQNFAYFVSTQQASLKSGVFETRLSRVCVGDISFRSYSEIIITCGTADATDLFNYATAAELGVIGSKDQVLLNLAKDEQILYVSFMQTYPNSDQVDKSYGSVVCGFPMNSVQDRFYKAVSDCFEGKDESHLLEQIIGPGEDTSCTRSGTFREEFMCGSASRNWYIGSSEEYESSPLVRVPGQKVTSLVSFVDKEQTVSIMGTASGLILKTLINNTILYNDTFSDDATDSEIRREAVVDKKSEFMYAATGNKVVKFPIRSCEIYTSCRACVATPDPQSCGWCGDKCCSLDDHPDISEERRRSCSPVIYRFSPSSGPLKGGTKVTIYGDNFGSSQSGAEHKITVSGVKCLVENWHNEMITCRTESTSYERSGVVEVDITDTSRVTGPFDIRGVAKSGDSFSFLEPKITDISPKFGPVSGGTVVVVRGSNLNVGSDRKILLLSSSSNISCIEKTNDGKELTCITGSYKLTADDQKKAIVKKAFHIQIDDWSLTTNFKLELRSDPVIDEVRPLASIQSGSTLVHVRGKNLTSMMESDPRLKLQVEGVKDPISFPCRVQDNTYMSCTTPKFPFDVPKYSSRSAKMYLGMNVTDLPHAEYRFKIFPVPEALVFVNKQQNVFIEDPVVEITGSNLSKEYDWDIRVGFSVLDNHTITHPCIPFEVDVSWTRLKCKIRFPANFEPAVGEELEVGYRVDTSAQLVRLGSLKFEHQPADKFSVALACGIIAIILIILCAIGLFIYIKRKSPEKEPKLQVLFNNTRTPENDYTGDNRSSDIPLMTPRPPPTIDAAIVAALTDCNKLLAKEWLTLGDIVGKGHFGRVFRARLYKPDTDETTDVAVKTMQNTGSFYPSLLRLRFFLSCMTDCMRVTWRTFSCNR